jgi:hypothetical protein
MSNKFLKTAEKHQTKSQSDHNKNMEVFNIERRKLEKDLKDQTEVVQEQKKMIKKLKEERSDLNIQLEDMRNEKLNWGSINDQALQEATKKDNEKKAQQLIEKNDQIFKLNTEVGQLKD